MHDAKDSYPNWAKRSGRAWPPCGGTRCGPSLGMLAILVAVATIVVVVTALDGVRRFAELSAARAFGSDTFVDRAGGARRPSISRKELELKLQRNPAIKRADARFLEPLRR